MDFDVSAAKRMIVFLTERQEKMRQIAGVIADYTRDWGYSPSVRDIRRLMGISSSSVVAYWLLQMHGEGLLTSSPNTARTIRLTAAGMQLLK